jgi:tRNA(adenine34) deaminase
VNDIELMQAALAEAELAASKGEVPVGAVVVLNGEIVGSGHNQPIGLNDPSAHAEMLAIRAAAQHLGNYRLSDCELFVTLEPCIMCAGAILHSRLKRIVYAAVDTKTGAAGSVINPFAVPQLNHQTQLVQGVCAHEASNMLSTFFALRRAAQKTAPELIQIDGLSNFRDLGGIKTSDGLVVKRKMLFRAEQLHGVPDGGLAQLSELQLRSIADFRSQAEYQRHPDPVLPAVKNHRFNVLADVEQTLAVDLAQLLENPALLQQHLGENQAATMMQSLYRDLVASPTAQQVYAQWLAGLCSIEQYPQLIHCTAGKDRTGWATVLLLSILGVPHERVLRDYLESDQRVLQKYQPVIDRFAAIGGDTAVLRDLLGVQAAYLKTAMHEVKKQAGTMARYIEHVLKITPAQQAQIRQHLLE